MRDVLAFVQALDGQPLPDFPTNLRPNEERIIARWLGVRHGATLSLSLDPSATQLVPATVHCWISLVSGRPGAWELDTLQEGGTDWVEDLQARPTLDGPGAAIWWSGAYVWGDHATVVGGQAAPEIAALEMRAESKRTIVPVSNPDGIFLIGAENLPVTLAAVDQHGNEVVLDGAPIVGSDTFPYWHLFDPDILGWNSGK